MENYIKNTDLINAYLNNTLSEIEKKAFEKRLETDIEFKETYNEQIVILEGIKRANLKTEINVAKQNYIRGKWFKYIGISVGVILISVLAFNLFFNTKTVNSIKENKQETFIDNAIIKSDSTHKKYTVIFKKDTSVLDKEKTKRYLVDYYQEKELIKFSGTLTLEEFKNKFPDSKHLKPINDSIVIHKKFNQEFKGKDHILVATEITEEVIPSQTSRTNNFEEHNQEPEEMPLNLKAFFKTNKKAPQIIEVNTEKAFTITCKEGTKLTIPAKSFVEIKTGKLARGKISLEVTEFYKLSDMLLANLTTKADDKQLETGGMLYLDANKKGEKLKLKSGRRIQVAFNSKSKKDMQLFNGEESSEGVNWKLDTQLNYQRQKPIEATIIKEIINEDAKIDFSIIEEVPVFKKCEEQEDNDAKRDCMDDAILKYVEREFNTSIAKELGLTGAQDINTYFEIEKNGTIGRIKVRTSNRALGNEMIRVIESMPKLSPGKQKGQPITTVYYLPFEILFKGKTVKKPLISVQSDKQFVNTINKRLDSVKSNVDTSKFTKREVERYVFGLSRLGWVNLDRFVNSNKQKIKYKFKIKDANGANVKMVFKSISSILPSKKYLNDYDFGMLPVDEEIKIIAIKEKDGKYFLSIKDTTTKANPSIDLDFKEVTIQELRQELEALNSAF